MSTITLPLESTITLHKDGASTIKHHTFVTGEVRQEFVEAAMALMGGSVEECIKAADEAARLRDKEAVSG